MTYLIAIALAVFVVAPLYALTRDWLRDRRRVRELDERLAARMRHPAG
jgi:hypothetical protein